MFQGECIQRQIAILIKKHPEFAAPNFDDIIFKNPKYMKENCAESCMWQAEEDKRTKMAIGKYFIPTIIYDASIICLHHEH